MAAACPRSTGGTQGHGPLYRAQQSHQPAGQHVTEQLHYTGNPPQTSYPITGGQLVLSYICPGIFDVNSCSATYVVKVPRRLEVQIDDKVGGTSLTGLAGQLILTSSTGNIDAKGLSAGFRLSAPHHGPFAGGFGAR